MKIGLCVHDIHRQWNFIESYHMLLSDTYVAWALNSDYPVQTSTLKLWLDKAQLSTFLPSNNCIITVPNLTRLPTTNYPLFDFSAWSMQYWWYDAPEHHWKHFKSNHQWSKWGSKVSVSWWYLALYCIKIWPSPPTTTRHQYELLKMANK